MDKMKGHFEQGLGLEIIQRNSEGVILRLPFRQDLHNALGFVHGGAICSLADTALAVCASVAFPQRHFSTLKLTVEFKRPVRTQSLIASAHIVRQRTNTFSGAVAVGDDQGNTIARAEGIFSLLPAGANSP